MSEFYTKDLSVRQSCDIIDPNFSTEELDFKNKEVFKMLKIFKRCEDRAIIQGEVRFHLIGHECDNPEKYPTSENIKEYIHDMGYLCCSMAEFVWFCVNKIPHIDDLIAVSSSSLLV